MPVQVVSDTHVEFWGFKLVDEASPMRSLFQKQRTPWLILAGDIGVVTDTEDCTQAINPHYKRFVTEMSREYELVILIAGNHEYYHGEFHNVNKLIADMCNSIERKNVIFLNNSSTVQTVEGVEYRIVGGTAWHDLADKDVDKLQNFGWNDFRLIHVKDEETEKEHLLTAAETVEMHRSFKRFLQSELAEAEAQNQSVLVVTHYPPFWDTKVAALGHQDVLHPHPALDDVMTTDFSKEMRSPMKAWVFGHTHQSVRATVNGVTVYSNQFGYPQHNGFDTHFSKDGSFTLPLPKH
eukprot:TRINITY_DN53722_c0_g1_i1.p1 TRINITY_DN53722_c0_g1~~TRINITY_DN53722_c0_g1_i1.p1  ORF type:complete len:326 (+),score=19.10 TRINITY_DN53722_c0_g1_i1:99-980(+)